MSEAVESRWPVLARHDRALEWLQIWTDLGRAPRTIDAYARGLAEYLQVCDREGIDPLAATRAQVALFVRELTSRPSRRGTNGAAVGSRTTRRMSTDFGRAGRNPLRHDRSRRLQPGGLVRGW